jgi:anti-sigma B factor antagonist
VDSARPPASPSHDEPACKVAVEQRDGEAVVVVSGELDLVCAPTLRACLVEHFREGRVGHHLVIDLTDVPFMDSTCLGVLVGACKRATSIGAGMTVIANPYARRLIETTGLDKLWAVLDAPA